MFIDYTFQDWQALGDDPKSKFLLDAINAYKGSADFLNALQANAYFSGNSPLIAQKTVVRADVVTTTDDKGRKRKRPKMTDVAGHRIGSSFLFRFVCQQNQYLLANGVTLGDDKQKAALGVGFDKALEQVGERALLHGVSWAFWNGDHIEPIAAAVDPYSGCFALLDEMTGEPGVVVQFWQLGHERPLWVRTFELDGVTWYRKALKERDLTVYTEKAPYKERRSTDAAGTIVLGAENYAALPVVPLYANTDKRSEFTPAIKEKIDAYDTITSDFADNLDRANDVYWVLNNFGGTVDDICATIETINRIKAVVNMTDGTSGGATAEPKTIDVPYNARQTALELLRKTLYHDYMAMDVMELTGGSLTNVAIKAAMLMMNLKADRYEWQCFQFVQRVLRLLGIDTEEISFKRQEFTNKSEIVADIQAMREDIDLETALKLNPYIMQEEIDAIMENVDASAVSTASTARRLQQMIDEKDDDEPDDE